jgi:acyl-coenzyme A thioesterase PaaI-like protein
LQNTFASQHLLSELGHEVSRAGPELRFRASISPQMHVPGLPHLRTSILAVWSDMLTGLLVAQATTPRVPVTLELDVQLYRPTPASGVIEGVARTLKAGRSVSVACAEFT